MFTQCPTCLTTYPLSKDQLLENSSFFCDGCAKEFNAFELLSDSSPSSTSSTKSTAATKSQTKTKSKAKKKTKHKQQNKKTVPTNNPDTKTNYQPTTIPANTPAIPGAAIDGDVLPWEVDKIPKEFPINWLAGCLLGCLALLGQIGYFEAENISQNHRYRPTLEKIASLFGQKLPTYQNLAEFEILQSSLNPRLDGNLEFKATISNQAVFKQRLPNIKLTLQDYSEETFAQRVFTPMDYATNLQGSHFMIEPDGTIEASLKIAATKTKVGGYQFDLIY